MASVHKKDGCTVVDKTALSTISVGSLNDESVIVKRNYCYDPISTRSLTNEIAMLGFLQRALESTPNADCVITMIQHSEMVDEYKRRAMALILKRGKMDVFDFSQQLNPKKRAIFTRNLMRRVLHIVRTLHELHVAHNDIKPENMVILDLSRPTSSVAFIDFGFASYFDPTLPAHVHAGHDCWLDNAYFGTSWYRHPNLLQFKPTNLQVADLYACGMVCFGMFTNWNAYSDDKPRVSVHKSFVDGSWQTKMPRLKQFAHDPLFLHWCSFIDELCSGRHTSVTDKLLAHPFLQG